MANWASDNLWGINSPWGSDTLSAQAAAGIARLIAQFADPAVSPNLHDVIAINGDRATQLLEISAQVLLAYALSTAEGTQLDAIGKRLDQPRLARSDALYRQILATKAKLVLPTQATAPQILEMCRALIPAGRQITIVDQPPAQFLLTIQDLTLDEFEILTPFVRDSKAGGVGAHFGYTPENALVVDSMQYPKSRRFDEVQNERVLWPNPGYAPKGDVAWSCSFWAYVNSAATATFPKFFALDDAAAIENVVYLQYIQASGLLNLVMKASTTNLSAISATAIPFDQWFQMVITYDGSGLRSGANAYVNGSPKAWGGGGNDLAGTAYGADGDWAIGNLASAAMTSGSRFDGDVAGPAIWSGVLSVANIAALAAGADPATIDVSNLKFDPDMATTIDSVSTNAAKEETGSQIVDAPSQLEPLPHLDPIEKVASTQGSGSYIEGLVSSIKSL